ncbi:MAG: tRNA lysidine(34) synthetase TilS [Proteobacteria bacterium]|nr:tRNA lysidine(34) synthetase TilS [Pseudomonadota bacterium]
MRLTADSFTPLMAAFAPFENNPVLAVAVSGGRDSLALMLLAAGWARARGGHAVGLIVDHGLRAEAAAEAATTRDLLAHHGIAADILRWDGAKPAHGIQAAARAARYRLLFDACRARGILHLLVAHHADDQAETIAMRAERGSGPDGLAGMAALVERREARLLRPVLGVARDTLTAVLTARGIRWIDDPSNADLRFERARLRAGGTLGREGPDTAAGERPGRESRLAAAAIDTLDRDGADLALDRDAFARLEPATAAGLLSRLVQAVGGRDHPPRRDRLERATARLANEVPAGDSGGKSGKSRDFTLSGCRLMLRRVPGSPRLRWIVRPENGTGNLRKERQPLVPAAFFACGGPPPPHVD